MKNKISDLRNHLFETIERLKDPELDLETEIQRAKAIKEVGSVIIESAKVEVDYLELMGGEESDFIRGNKLLEK
ncbi:MAG: hypothetical protein WCG90_08315 [Chitinophagia bacterium]